MNVEQRDALAAAPADVLVAHGLLPGEDYADAASPGPTWREQIMERQATERRERALKALGELTPADVRALLEALGGE